MQSSAHAQTVMLPDYGTAGERPEPDLLRADAALQHSLRQREIIGDMRELQPIGNRLFVAFCYRHLPSADRNEIIQSGHGVAICVRRRRCSPDRWQMPGSAIYQQKFRLLDFSRHSVA
jgi:hypothetical protein